VPLTVSTSAAAIPSVCDKPHEKGHPDSISFATFILALMVMQELEWVGNRTSKPAFYLEKKVQTAR